MRQKVNAVHQKRCVSKKMLSCGSNTVDSGRKGSTRARVDEGDYSTRAKSLKQDGTIQKSVPRRKVCFVNFYFQCTLQNGYLAAHSALTKNFWTQVQL